MSLEEALAWLRGERSGANYFRTHGSELERETSLACYDAAMTQQAYWIVRAHKEGLT